MKLIVATNNAHKLKEIKSILGGEFEEILSLKEAGAELKAEENGSTFEENAIIKARGGIQAVWRYLPMTAGYV